jgi:ribosomal protein S18 acetylase RimI-like enzyme
MVTGSLVANLVCRSLDAHDIERVIAIDHAASGQSRRRFFEKRFATAQSQPQDFVHVGVEQGGSLHGYIIARVLRGEFGQQQPVAALDAIGVETESRERGIGQLLMRELMQALASRGIGTLQSEADWTNHELVRFFDTAGFKLAPRLTLQRAVASPLDETAEEI